MWNIWANQNWADPNSIQIMFHLMNMDYLYCGESICVLHNLFWRLLGLKLFSRHSVNPAVSRICCLLRLVFNVSYKWEGPPSPRRYGSASTLGTSRISTLTGSNLPLEHFTSQLSLVARFVSMAKSEFVVRPTPTVACGCFYMVSGRLILNWGPSKLKFGVYCWNLSILGNCIHLKLTSISSSLWHNDSWLNHGLNFEKKMVLFGERLHWNW